MAEEETMEVESDIEERRRGEGGERGEWGKTSRGGRREEGGGNHRVT